MNGDKSISVNDVGLIINLILNEGAAASRQEMQKAVEDAQLSLQTATNGYELLLENKDDFIGFQFDVKLNSGETIDAIKLAGSDDHLMTYRKLDNGTWRVICYSPTNSTFLAGNPALLNISTIEEINICNIRLTTAGLGELSADDMSASTTGITETFINQASELKVYTLDGRLCRSINAQSGENPLKGLKAGIYMIGNRKVVVR